MRGKIRELIKEEGLYVVCMNGICEYTGRLAFFVQHKKFVQHKNTHNKER